MTLGIGLYDTADFVNWYLDRHKLGSSTSYRAWGRHRSQEHYVTVQKVHTPDGGIIDLDKLVDDLFLAWQEKNKGVVPSAKEVREWLRLRATIRADMEARRNSEHLTEMMMNAGHRAKEEENAIQVAR